MSNILSKTESVCPYCLKKIDAFYVEKNDDIYFEKKCERHGEFSVIAWKGLSSFKAWKGPLANVINENPQTKVEKGCPYDCGICGEHLQSTCCVLLEVTSKCNLNCPVCFAKSSSEGLNEDPNLNKINSWYDMLISHGGPFNIQLSGGEPSIRNDLPDIIKMGKEKGFSFFQINTNGIRISEDINYLKSLVDSGLNTVFLQFDGLSDESYIKLRGMKLLKIKLKAIENCKKVNVGVVLVPTIKKGVNVHEIGDILKFAANNLPIIRGVNFQPISFFGRYKEIPTNDDRLVIPELILEMEKQMNNEINYDDFSHGNAEHPFCSFHSDYIIEDGHFKKIKTNKQSCCSTSKKSREVVAHKWTIQKESYAKNKSLYKADSFDAFLRKRNSSTLSISGMAFQDAWNLDIERLKRCYIHEVSQDGRLIPFCAYNLTDIYGEPLYRGKDSDD